MSPTLNSLLKEVSCLAIIGMEKNAGKTTVLNSLIKGEKERIVGITSIGYDGESVDQVTGTDKPVIWIKAGSLVATAVSLLGMCDFTRELIEFTGFHTAVGEVIILRALSDGYVQIAGPSIVSQMSELVSTLKRNGAELVIIDGAASRKSTASITFADGCILATGASYSHKMNTVIAETAYYAELLSIPRFPDREILLKNLQELINKSALENSQETTENQCFFFSTNGLFRLAGSCFATETVDTLDANKGTFDGIFFNGILTKIIVDRLLSKFRDFKGLNLVTLDGNGIQISSNQYFTLKQRNMNFYVINPINLLAVTSNPTSPAGICFKKEEFKNLLQKNIKAPVFDVYDSGLHLQ